MNRGKPTHGVKMDLGTPTIVMVTVCTKGREAWLTSPDVREALKETWRNADAWAVGAYMIMPDHLHLFCSPRSREISLGRWVKHWKRQFTRLRLPGTGRWQRDYWDTRIRTNESYSEKWKHIRLNPVRACLVDSADAWPYQGVLNVLRW